MSISTFIVDSFTDTPFKGNPAGVCLINQAMNVELMQSIATELNLSETSFVLQQNKNQFKIRYFTPTVEVDFCGHATLAAAKIILEELEYSSVEFETYKGLKLNAKPDGEFIKMKFPLFETVESIPSPELLDAFGIEKPIAVHFSQALDLLLIEVENKEALLSISPNYQKAIESSNTLKELVVTTISEDEEYDFYSRCFCPWIGINEDPVTGAVHSVLAKYWSNKLNKNKMRAFQLSKRGGFLNLTITEEDILEVKSKATIILVGEIKL